MVLGLFGIASATSFPDDAKIQYKEAVDVMTGIGSINGMGDGTFAPTGKVTRAQAAKMVAYAILGADVAKDLPVSASSFKDVDSNYNWAIPSIEYLADRGIVGGRSGRGGNYDPEGEVTAYEIAKMLLCAAGYGKNGEFTGNSWALNVAIVAQKNGIFTGSKAADRNKAATREECALYCFNGLTKVDRVNYNKNEGAYKPIAKGENIGKDVYGLAKSEDKKEDTFKRPASIWNVDNAKVPNLTNPIASTAVAPVATYHDASYAKAFADYEFDANVEIYNNGAKWTVDADEDGKGGTAKDLAATKLNGTGIELYNTDNEKDIDVIVMTQAFLAKVTDYTATKTAANGSFELAIYNPWEKTIPTGTGTKTVTDDTKKSDDLFDKLLAASLKKNDYFMVYTAGADVTGDPVVMKFAAATTTTGKLSSYSATDNDDGFNGNVTVDGTKYTLASACVMSNTTGFISNHTTGTKLEDNLNKNVTIFIDEYGMVVGIVPETVADSTTYGLVLGYDYTAKTLTKPASADILLAQQDGTVNVFAQPANPLTGTVDDLTSIFALNFTPASEKTACFVSYTIADGNLVKIAVAGTEDTLKNDYDAKGNMMVLTKYAAPVYLNYATTTIYFDTKSAYDATKNPVKVVKSYANTENVATGKAVTYVMDADNPTLANVLFVPQKAISSVAGNFIYIFDTNYSVSSVNGQTVYTYGGFVNGEAATITTTDNATIDAAGLYTYALANGAAVNIADASAAEAGKVTVFDTGYIVTDAANTIKYNSSTTFYLVDSNNKTITAGPIVPDATKTYTVLNAVPQAGKTVQSDAAAAIYYTVS